MIKKRQSIILEFWQKGGAMSIGLKPRIRDIKGKTIKGLIINEDIPTSPYNQIFLVFTDDTFYEFYGQQISTTNGIATGALEYAEKFPGNKTVVFDSDNERLAVEIGDNIKSEVIDLWQDGIDLMAWLKSLPQGAKLRVLSSEEAKSVRQSIDEDLFDDDDARRLKDEERREHVK